MMATLCRNGPHPISVQSCLPFDRDSKALSHESYILYRFALRVHKSDFIVVKVTHFGPFGPPNRSVHKRTAVDRVPDYGGGSPSFIWRLSPHGMYGRERFGTNKR